MRTLTIQEQNHVAGGTDEALIWLGIGAAAIVITAIAAAGSRNRCSTTYEPVTTYYDVVTPVYDPYGYYQYDIIDTYAEVSYVPVSVCY